MPGVRTSNPGLNQKYGLGMPATLDEGGERWPSQRQVAIKAGAKRYRLDELLGGASMVSRGDEFDYGIDPLTDLFEHRRRGWIIPEQREQRWLMRNDAHNEADVV